MVIRLQNWSLFSWVELAIEGHNDRTIYYEIQRQKAIEKELGCVFIRINPDTLKNQLKKSLISKISKTIRIKNLSQIIQ